MSVPSYRALRPDEKAWLLQWARRNIEGHLCGPMPAEADLEVPLGCQQHLACFLSLHGTDAQLRGSMGALERHEPLWRQVGQVAVAAAVRDPRFRPLTLAELDHTVLEIVCLTPPEATTPQGVRPGKDGVWVEHGASRGVLLPAPAGDGRAWELESYLAEACRRAGLEPHAWRRRDVTLARFATDAFSEAERLQ